MELNRPLEALPHLETALEWRRILVERAPNNARYARDWSGIHGAIGLAQIALDRFDEGLANLQAGVQLTENLIRRDPVNGTSQLQLIESLQQQANGLVKIANFPGTGSVRQMELLRQAVQSLTRCQGRLALPELERIRPQLSKKAKEITQELEEARSALAKMSSAAEARPTKP